MVGSTAVADQIDSIVPPFSVCNANNQYRCRARQVAAIFEPYLRYRRHYLTTDELPRFSQDRLTQQKRKEANRRQQMGKTGQTHRGARVAGNKSGGS